MTGAHRRNLQLEALLAARIGRMKCAGCGKELGNTPRRDLTDKPGAGPEVA